MVGWIPMIEGDVLAPDAIWAWRYAERAFPADRLLGFSMIHDDACRQALARAQREGGNG